MLTVPRQAPATASLDPLFATLREREFASLDETGIAYLDYTGSALPAARQLRAHNESLTSGVFANPHADSDASRRSTAALDAVRSLLLAHLDADESEYAVCFAANATAAIKLVAESYGFAPNGVYALAADNHNSVNGVREFARRAGARIAYLPIDEDLRLVSGAERLAEIADCSGTKLFAFPAQSNFSGVRHALEFIGIAQQRGFDILLDAAAYLPTCALSLRTVRPEFVALSFYKLFGFPTGLGALVARRDALSRLTRPWFAGGTVEYVSVQNDRHSLAPGPAGFEDGTPHFLGAAAIPAGFEVLSEVGMTRLGTHVGCLTAVLLDGLRDAKHLDGSPAVAIYGPRDTQQRGGTVAFNILKPDGRIVPYWVVEERARSLGVALRGGCFCNPGAAERAFGFPPEAAERCMSVSRPGEFSVRRFAECVSPDGQFAVGAMRASLGLANNVADVRRALGVVESFLE